MVKLAELLVRKSNLKKSICEEESYLQRYLKVNEDEMPEENVPDMLVQLEKHYEELNTLTNTIAQYNNTYRLESLASDVDQQGPTIAEAIIMRDILKTRHNLYTRLQSHASGSLVDRSYVGKEIVLTKKVVLIPYADIRTKCAKLKAQLLDLESKLQRANWQCECTECV